MPVSEGRVIERVARVLCAQRLSANAEGSNPSAGEAVDAAWQEHRDDAIAILKTLREPDPPMATAGDAMIWENMVRAALGDRRAIPAEGYDRLHRAPIRCTKAPDPAGQPMLSG